MTSPADRLPDTRWRVALPMAALAALLLLLPIESYARRSGIAAQVPDTPVAWLEEWRRLPPDGIAIIGSSRAQYDLSTSMLRASLGREVVQLAEVQSSGLEALEALARREEFRGVVLFDLLPRSLFGASEEIQRLHAGSRLAAEASPVSRWNNTLRILMARLCAPVGALNPRVCLRAWALALLGGETPVADYLDRGPRRGALMDAERYPHWDTEGAGFARARVTGAPRASQDAYRERLDRVARACRLLRDRGAAVVLLRLPVGGALLKAEDGRFPDGEFWDPVVASAGGWTIDFRRDPDLQGFTCCDGSHLVGSDVPRFTEAFLRRLRSLLRTMGRL